MISALFPPHSCGVKNSSNLQHRQRFENRRRTSHCGPSYDCDHNDDNDGIVDFAVIKVNLALHLTGKVYDGNKEIVGCLTNEWLQ